MYLDTDCTPRRERATGGPPRLVSAWRGGVLLARQRADAELDLIGSLLSDTSLAYPIAEASGIREQHFTQPDLRLIYTAVEDAYWAEKLIVCRIARARLKQHGFWDPTQIRGNVGSMQHSDASLAALACSWPYVTAAVRSNCDRLIAIIRRTIQIHKHLAALDSEWHLLATAESRPRSWPPTPAEQPQRQIPEYA